jgi:hypothetical protein
MNMNLEIQKKQNMEQDEILNDHEERIQWSES